ncbi:hypothetical protein [Schlesneria paludicola]|uniref:hypothetical protein n=1 Tax=Schlesneria paludicola TaxID=360056 RepID=UPI0012FB980C|nr:hypothetical protein [Schlesneria paludicola]
MTVTTVEQCSVEQLVEAINRRKPSGPVSLNLIRKVLPKPIRQCDEALAEALRIGAVWKYGAVRRIDQYWTEPPAEYAWKLVEQKLQKNPSGVTQKEIQKIATSPVLSGVLDAHDWIASLSSSGRLFAQVRVGKTRKEIFTTDQYDFVDRLIDQAVANLKDLAEQNQLTLGAVMERALKRLSSDCGMNAEKVETRPQSAAVDSKPPATFGHLLETVSTSEEDSTPDSEVREQILQAMRDINPRADEGSPVLMHELRQRLDFQQIEKLRFDHILLDLYRAQQVLLFKTSSAQLTSDERHSFVSDADGNFYNAVTFWRK